MEITEMVNVQCKHMATLLVLYTFQHSVRFHYHFPIVSFRATEILILIVERKLSVVKIEIIG